MCVHIYTSTYIHIYIYRYMDTYINIFIYILWEVTLATDKSNDLDHFAK